MLVFLHLHKPSNSHPVTSFAQYDSGDLFAMLVGGGIIRILEEQARNATRSVDSGR